MVGVYGTVFLNEMSEMFNVNWSSDLGDNIASWGFYVQVVSAEAGGVSDDRRWWSLDVSEICE